MNEKKYNLNMDVKYDYLEVIKVPEIIKTAKKDGSTKHFVK